MSNYWQSVEEFMNIMTQQTTLTQIYQIWADLEGDEISFETENHRDQIFKDIKQYVSFLVSIGYPIDKNDLIYEWGSSRSNRKASITSQTIKGRFDNWRQGKTVGLDLMVKFTTVLTYLLTFAGEDHYVLATYDGLVSADWPDLSIEDKKTMTYSEIAIHEIPFDRKRIVDSCLVSLNIDKVIGSTMVQTHSNLISLLIFTVLIQVRNDHEQQLSTTLIRYLAKLQSHPIEEKYLKQLWNECRWIRVRDASNNINQQQLLCDYYVCPSFIGSSHSPIEGISKFQRILEAPTGFGKSSFLQSIVASAIISPLKEHYPSILEDLETNAIDLFVKLKQDLRMNKDYLPIYITASDYKRLMYNMNPPQDQLINLLVHKYDPNSSIEVWSQMLVDANKQHRLLLLVDALDEIPEHDLLSFCQKIDHFMSKYDHTSLIVTTRPIGRDLYRNDLIYTLPQCEFWQLSEFNDTQIIALCEKQLKSTLEGSSAFAHIIQNPYLYSFAKNPFMLSQMLLRYTPNLEPYHALKQIIDQLITKRWPMLDYQNHLDPHTLRLILGAISWEMLQQEMSQMPKPNLVIWFKRYSDLLYEMGYGDRVSLDIWKSFVTTINTCAGLLIPEGEGYIFISKEIQHYLAAEWLLIQLQHPFDQGNTPPTELEIYVKLCELLPTIQWSEAWNEIFVMFFTQSNHLMKKDYYTIGTVKYILQKWVLAHHYNEKNSIETLLIKVLNQTFGENRYINNNHQSIHDLIQNVLTHRNTHNLGG